MCVIAFKLGEYFKTWQSIFPLGFEIAGKSTIFKFLAPLLLNYR